MCLGAARRRSTGTVSRSSAAAVLPLIHPERSVSGRDPRPSVRPPRPSAGCLSTGVEAGGPRVSEVQSRKRTRCVEQCDCRFDRQCYRVTSDSDPRIYLASSSSCGDFGGRCSSSRAPFWNQHWGSVSVSCSPAKLDRNPSCPINHCDPHF